MQTVTQESCKTLTVDLQDLYLRTRKRLPIFRVKKYCLLLHFRLLLRLARVEHLKLRGLLRSKYYFTYGLRRHTFIFLVKWVRPTRILYPII
jgi:hypothetical protein